MIDSIPANGILLDKGWKYTAGDDPDYAKPDYDDSKWQAINPTADIQELPQLKHGGEIKVVTEDGVFTEFVIQLPLS